MQKSPSLLRNWISLLGLILAICSFFAVVCLISIDFFLGFRNPYMGILTYLVAPGFLSAGLILLIAGALLERRARRRLAPGEVPRHPQIDFNIPRHRNTFILVAVVTIVFLFLTAIGSYRTYHFTESVEFCGQTCHVVMKPEFTAYQNSPHARVTCTQCHIGPGAGWFVRSKLSGSYQVYATLTEKYPKPIPTPVKNLRPAQETCEQCHWPAKFFGAAERMNVHYLADEENTKWTIRLLMKVGGGDPAHGPTGGIHWHMNLANKVEYVHTDEERQIIPWVRVTTADGKVTEYQSNENPLSAEQKSKLALRSMDCIDCHNRPSHNYNSPARAVNLAMSTGRISTNLPSIKRNAVEALIGEYKTTGEALTSIKNALMKAYAQHSEPSTVEKAIRETQDIYAKNFFPEMNVNWRVYPNNIGHSIFPGCYRCHDGKHVNSEGKAISHDCNSCHIIISQGKEGVESGQISADGLEFEHPVDIGELWKEMNCTECHSGALAQ